MTKKKRSAPTLETVLARPWCYYCERDFDDLKVLMQHQKAKHFKCNNCTRRLNTAGGLVVHMTQVHKEELHQVENALPARSSPHIEIFGMEGIPEDVVQAHNYRIAQLYESEQSERQIATGNPPRGAAGEAGNAPKKPKVESIQDLKARLAAHKAAKAAEAAGRAAQSGGSGSSTPAGPVDNTPQHFQAPSQGIPAPDHYNAFAAPPGTQQQAIGYGLGAPPAMLNYNQYPDFQPPGPTSHFRASAPGQSSQLSHPADHSLPNLPLPPGLPARPALVPNVSLGQMQQLHSGQSQYLPNTLQPSQPLAENATDAPHVVAPPAGIAQESDEQAGSKTSAVEQPKTSDHANGEETQGFVYNDNEFSPEEKMAKMARYKW